MPLYRAKYVGRSGRRSTLVLDAVDMESFAEHIESYRKAYVIDIRRVQASRGRLTRVRVPGALLLAALDSLELMLETGVRVNTAVRTLSECAPSGATRMFWTEVARGIEETGDFGEALRPFPGVFNDSMVAMIASHEAAGRLADGVRHVRSYAAQMLEIRRETTRALAYPALVCAAALGASVIACVFTLPRFSKMLGEIGVIHVHGITSVFFALSDFVVGHPLLAATLAAVPFTLAAALRMPRLRPTLDRAILRIPVVRQAVEALAMARICATFRALSLSGIRVVEALESCASVAGNTVYSRAIRSVAAAVRENATIGVGFERARVFAPEVVLAVKSAEGSLTEVFGRLSAHYNAEARHRVSFALSLIEPAILVVVLLWVFGVALAVVLPVVEVLNQVH